MFTFVYARNSYINDYFCLFVKSEQTLVVYILKTCVFIADYGSDCNKSSDCWSWLMTCHNNICVCDANKANTKQFIISQSNSKYICQGQYKLRLIIYIN